MMPERRAILAGLGVDDSRERDRAIGLAARHLEPAELAALVAEEGDARRRNAALEALERQGPYAVEHLGELAAGDDAELAMFALQVLAKVRAPALVPRLLPLVRHPDQNVAQAAIVALGHARASEAVPALVDAMRHSFWLGIAAIDALAEIGDARAVDPLLEVARGGALRLEAIGALARIAGSDAVSPLLARLRDASDDATRDALLNAIGAVLGRAPEMRVEGTLADLLPYLDRALRATGFEGQQGVDVGASQPDDRAVPRGGGSLARAAGRLALAAGLRELFPAVVAYAADPVGAAWVAEAWGARRSEREADLAVLVNHVDPEIRAGALAVGEFTPEQLWRRLEDSDPRVRAAAIRAAGRIMTVELVPALVRGLEGGDALERGAAIEALGCHAPEDLGPLGPWLAEKAPEDRLLVGLKVLATATPGPFTGRVVALLRARSPAVRQAALRALARTHGVEVDQMLLRALGDVDPGVQTEALELLVGRGGVAAVRTLLALLGTRDSLRHRVIRALGQLRIAEAGPRLMTLFADAPLHEQVEILAALTRIAPDELIGFLVTRLEDPSLEVRRAAAHGLALHAGAAGVNVLARLGDDADWYIRNEAAAGLGRLGGGAPRDLLLSLCRDVNAIVRATARTALDGLSRVAGA